MEGEILTIEEFVQRVSELIKTNTIDDIEGGNKLYRFKIGSIWYEICYQLIGIYASQAQLYKGKYSFATSTPVYTTIKIERPTHEQIILISHLFCKLHVSLMCK